MNKLLEENIEETHVFKEMPLILTENVNVKGFTWWLELHK